MDGKNIEKQQSVSCIGTLYTFTVFNLNGVTIKIKVGFNSECNISRKITWYHPYIYIKQYKHKKFVLRTDLKIEDLLTKQEIYDCYYNHWCNLNPLKEFSTSSVDGVNVAFSVKGKVPDITAIKELTWWPEN